MLKTTVTDFLKERFWKIVLVVLVFGVIVFSTFLFLKRSIYPDTSFDTVNYHFFLGKEGFENFPFFFKESEFYPLGLHSFNPIMDMIGYGSYLLFGYRIGTIFSLLFFLGSVLLGYIFLKNGSCGEKKWVGISLFLLSVVPIFIVNEGLFQIATFFTDNAYVFFGMMALYVVLKFTKIHTKKFEILLVIAFGLCLGILFTKLTNIIYILPLMFVFGYLLLYRYKNLLRKDSLKRIFSLFLILGSIILIVNFFAFLNIKESGNPFFPFMNSIFKSIYFPEVSWHFNFGPKTFLEQIFYPAYAMVNPVLMGEGKDLFPDRKLLVIFFYVAFVSLIFLFKRKKISQYEKILLFVFLSSFFLWQILFGYSRYAIFLEILGGIVGSFFVLRIFSEERSGYVLKVLTLVYIGCLIFQTVNIISFNSKYDISWRPNPTFSEWRNIFFSPIIFQKYSNVDSSIKSVFNGVNFVFQCVTPSSVYFSTMSELTWLPMLNFDKQSNGEMTTDVEFIKERNKHFKNSSNELNRKVQSVSIINKRYEGAIEQCEKELILGGMKIERRLTVNNFIGNRGESLILLISTVGNEK